MLICSKFQNMKYRLFLFFSLIIIVASCARRGRPEGGPEDMDKPIMVKAIPAFESVNFKSKEIKIYFDEYIKLKDITSQLIVSPPLKYPVVITPQGTPSKYITIKLQDTLQENTTYTFNFGQSILDNTEGNILENFKYIVSTGDYIDSLEVKGTIKDAFNLKMKEKPILMLYEADENFNDSIIYKEKPYYVGSTLDSINWSITNIKAGKYLLVALNDYSKNYIFNPKDDNIGFHTQHITVPTDTVYKISLFKEILPFKLVSKPAEANNGHLLFGYEGDAKDFKVKVISDTVSDYKSISTFDKSKDTLHYWYKNFDQDSIYFERINQVVIDSVKINLFEKDIDSLSLKNTVAGTLHLRDTLKILTNTPVIKIDTAKISFINQDSIKIVYHTILSKDKQEIRFNFEKEFDKKYMLNLLPGAVTDFFDVENDSLKVNFNTKKPTNYCSIFLTLKNIESYPLIVQLIDEKGAVMAYFYSEFDQEYKFENLQPSRYKVRIIYDTNGNKKWDTGNFLIKQQPEEVYYFKNVIDAKANWEVIEIFTIL